MSGAHKAGGTAMALGGSTVGRVHYTFNDPHGRWNTLGLCGERSDLIIVNLCHTWRKPNQVSGLTAHHQQQAAFLAEGGSVTDPRQNVRHDLINHIHSVKKANCELLIVGDFNESICDNDTLLQQLSATFGLHDIWRMHFPHCVEPHTHFRGSKRIDCALGTMATVEATRLIGHEPFLFSAATDHRGSFMDIDSPASLGNSTAALVASPHRIVNTKKPAVTACFIAHACDHGKHNDLCDRLTRPSKSPTPDHELLEKLDDITGQTFVVGKNSCPTVRRMPTSAIIAKLRNERRVLQMMLSAARNGRSHDAQRLILDECKTHKLDIDVHVTVPDILSRLHHVKKELNEAIDEAPENRKQEFDEKIQMAHDTDDLVKA